MKMSKNIGKSLSIYFSQTTDLSKKSLIDRSKHSHFKKSSSLPIYYLNKDRIKEITEIYRSMSTDKITTHTSKTRRNSPSARQKHPFTLLHSNLVSEPKQKTKLTIQRGQENKTHVQPSSSWVQLAIKLRSITDRLQELSNIKSEENFLTGFEKYLQNLRTESHKKYYSGREQLLNCMKLLIQCMQRNEKSKIGQVRASYDESISQLSSLESQLKKKCVRAILDQKQIERQQQIVCSLQQKIKQMNTCKQNKKQACFGTEDKEIHFTRTTDYDCGQTMLLNTQILTLTPQDGFYGKKCCNCKQELMRKNHQLTEFIKKFQAVNRKQRDMLSVLAVLRGEGVNVQRIYQQILNGSIEVPQNDSSEVQQSIENIRKQQRKIYKQLKAIPNRNEIDADDSIISSADGLSFDYDEKSFEADVYTIRREYKCKKQLSPEMKQKLKLNFDVLYDQQLYEEDYESEYEPAAVPPTF